VIGVVAACILVLAGIHRSEWLWGTIIVAALANFAAAAYQKLMNPLPPNVETFRDLSMLIASQRQ